MTPLIWSSLAERDVQAIRAYIAEDSARYADLVVRRIVAGVEHLAEFPESGRIVPERDDPTIRQVMVGPFRVVYRYRGDSVESVTVFRSARMFPADLP